MIYVCYDKLKNIHLDMEQPQSSNTALPRHRIRVQFHNRVCITKTCLYNFDPLKPHFCIVKLGITGVYITFLISAQKLDCGYSLEPPRLGDCNEYPNLYFEQKYKKISEFFYLKIFSFGDEIFYIFE